MIVPSLAAGAGKSGSKHKGRSSAPKALPAPAVKSESWLVKVNGQEHAVKNGGTFTYSPGDEIESITPKVLIVATKKGAYGYGYRFDGPKGAETGITEGSFEGTQDSLAPPFIPLALVYGPEGKITNEATMFSPGGYRFELRLYGSTMHATFFLEEFERKKPALTATLTLAEK